ncbi:MAG: transporter [Capsulimonas sp.]|uniref:transporter n=1 Tax=Capsulimonas sp. TaxID=2494211 RepID=UPI003266054C
MKAPYYFAACAALLCAAAQPVIAGPVAIDGPGTTEPGRYTLDIAVNSSQVSGSESQTLPAINLSYGLTNNIEVGTGIAVSSFRNSGASRKTGFGDTTVGAKWRFLEETKSAPQVAIDYGLKIPTASKSEGFGDGKYASNFGICAAKSYGHYGVGLAASYYMPGNALAKNCWSYSAACTCQVTERTSVGAQVYGGSPGADGARTNLGYLVGVSQTFAPDRNFSLQIGKSERGYADLTVFGCLEFILGKGRHKAE